MSKQPTPSVSSGTAPDKSSEAATGSPRTMMPARWASPSRAQTAQRQGQVQERRLSPIVVSTVKGLPVASS